ncbi:MAG: signal peptidase II, partial [Chloroflexi bacterium]|nr:signal peptidase II [Chloroflexota bacterium]
TDLHQLIVALWPLLLFYCLGCALVAWSRRANRGTSGRGLALLVVVMVALDQVSKTAISVFVPPNATLPLVKGWLHLANVTGSWLTPAWFKPVLILAIILVVSLSVIVYRYYVSSKRRSLWADLVFLGIFAGYVTRLCDISLRGYTLDFIQMPGLVTFDFGDLFLSLGLCAVIEMLDNPGISLRWDGWRVELESTRRINTDIAAFAAEDLRSWWAAIGLTGKGRDAPKD